MVLALLLFGNIFERGNNELKTEKVAYGTIIQEVSETGAVRSTQEIELGFKTAGRISKLKPVDALRYE